MLYCINYLHDDFFLVRNRDYIEIICLNIIIKAPIAS